MLYGNKFLNIEAFFSILPTIFSISFSFFKNMLYLCSRIENLFIKKFNF